tara:strand:+ start:159 stop:896 length:738 start_codon:yes stop_codon:yes gene_type:complete
MPIKMKLIKSGVVTATLFNAVLSTTNLAAELEKPVTTAIETTTVMHEANNNNKRSEVRADSISKLALMDKLAKIEFFSATFSQQVFDEAGNELQQGSGLLSVSKPNLVHWQTILPDESLIVSDGENLWFYDPFVEQVSVYSLESAIANTPILLITSNDEKLWQDYSVSQLTTNRYLISSNSKNSRVKSLELSFVQNIDNVELAAFNILDATGQLSVISLTHENKTPDPSLFTFAVPEGVYLDDQR